MKKNILFIFLVLLTVFLVSCTGSNSGSGSEASSHETAFQAMKELRQNSKSRHIQSTVWNYFTDGSSQSFTAERFIENDIEYNITSNGTKRYYDWRNDDLYYDYTYNTSDGKWHRSSNRISSSSGGIDFWDINNYDYRNGSFYLKAQYTIDDQISYKVTILNDSSYEYRDEYTFRVDGLTIRRVDVSVVSRFGETFNLKLPTNYVN